MSYYARPPKPVADGLATASTLAMYERLLEAKEADVARLSEELLAANSEAARLRTQVLLKDERVRHAEEVVAELRRQLGDLWGERPGRGEQVTAPLRPRARPPWRRAAS